MWDAFETQAVDAGCLGFVATCARVVRLRFLSVYISSRSLEIVLSCEP